ncbi:IS3 family transposase [Streptomyces sp. NPDC001812]|uniref:IS3 family transposase n=1 Tax=unclassified Streptomyces TaxID=2593676 RepID=UPI0036656578
MRDTELKKLIRQVHTDNHRVHGARKIWREPTRRGHQAARCTAERLLREPGIAGAVRGKRVLTTMPDQQAERAPGRVDRDFAAGAPNRCRAGDLTHAATWPAVVHLAFALDTFSRRIAGRPAATPKEPRLVLDTLKTALWQRDRDEYPYVRGELTHHSDADSQYTGVRPAGHPDAAGIAAPTGSAGDAYDNAPRKSTIGPCKTERLKPQRPWKTLSPSSRPPPVWTDWHNHRGLHGETAPVPPVEDEADHSMESKKPQVTTTM